MVERDQIHTVQDVVQASGGQFIRTDKAAFGVVKGPDIMKGDMLKIGNVCGGWCFIFVRGEKLRANILEQSETSTVFSS